MKVSKPEAFQIRYQPTTRRDGRAWAVRRGSRWQSAREVSMLVPTFTKPDGTVFGEGVVTRAPGGSIVITP